MRRRRSKLGGRSIQRLTRILLSGKWDTLSEGEIAKIKGNDPRTARLFAPWIAFSTKVTKERAKAPEGERTKYAVFPLAPRKKLSPNKYAQTLDPHDWIAVLQKDPTAIECMPKQSMNYAAIIPAGFGELCGMSKFSGAMWRRIILKEPLCIKYCDISKLSESDWASLYPVREECVRALKMEK